MTKRILKCSICKKNHKYSGKGRPPATCKKCRGR